MVLHVILMTLGVKTVRYIRENPKTGVFFFFFWRGISNVVLSYRWGPDVGTGRIFQPLT